MTAPSARDGYWSAVLLALIAATALVQRSNAAITPLQCTEQINYFSQNGRYDCPIHMCVDPFDDGGCNGCCAPGGASGSGSGASGNLPPSFSAGAAGGHGCVGNGNVR